MAIDLELLYRLAVLPNATDIDWRAEFARQHVDAEAKEAALRRKIADLEKRLAGNEVESLAKSLAELTGRSVNIDHVAWYHPSLSRPEARVEYCIYQDGESFRGQTLAEAEAKFRETWDRRHRASAEIADSIETEPINQATE